MMREMPTKVTRIRTTANRWLVILYTTFSTCPCSDCCDKDEWRCPFSGSSQRRDELFVKELSSLLYKGSKVLFKLCHDFE